jgi:hypothetical protein
LLAWSTTGPPRPCGDGNDGDDDDDDDDDAGALWWSPWW